jgi:hypothetical protein
MFALTNKPDMGARLYKGLIQLASDPVRGTDAMKLIQHLAGVLVETCLVFDHPDEALQASFYKLSKLLHCDPMEVTLTYNTLPPAHVIDFETERGRQAAREFFVDWLDCSFEFHNLFIEIIHNVFVSWEDDGQLRAESLRLLIECAQRCMSFEISAQELCDVVIDEKVAKKHWSLADCIAALSAVAGRRLALSLNAETCSIFRGADIPENLDQVVYVMTQEAVRLGVPPGSNWRFGLPANDMPVDAPNELIEEIDPHCRSFFRAIALDNLYDQAVAASKAAGRMLAVAAGGEAPEMEPAIAKPLAMAAITETYKSVCMTYQIATC